MLFSHRAVFSQIRSWKLQEKIIVGGIVLLVLILGFIFSFKCSKQTPIHNSHADPSQNLKTSALTEPPSVQTPSQETLPLAFQNATDYVELPDGTKIPVKKISQIKMDGALSNSSDANGIKPLALPMKVYQDHFMGFSIRIPENWHLNATQGKILVKKDPQALTGVIVYPVILKEDMNALQFLKMSFSIYEGIYKNHQGSLSLENVEERGKSAKGQFQGVLQGVQIQGMVQATVEGRRGNYRAFWAPIADFPSLKQVLQVVSESFKSFQGEPLKLYQGNVFQIYYPEGWQVSETQNGIDVVDATDQTAVSIAILMYVPGNPDPFHFMDWNLHQLQIQNGLILQQKNYPAFKDALGQSWQIGGREMEYDWKGEHFRSVITSGILRQMICFSGMVSVRQAPIQRWEEVSPMLEAIEKSFKVLHPEKMGGGAQSMVLPTNHPADTSSVMESWEAKNEAEARAEGHWSEYMQGGGYRESAKTGGQVWVTPQDYDPGRGGYINPNDPSDVIAE
ncbi:MAG: hypothetical protein HYS07_05310 [Chlamydiae bacterium]|nr:hypothetical protein [Chlamydiota bacterium]MBI3278005.1 hypothetical protein [Chlamydiota bacterium]